MSLLRRLTPHLVFVLVMLTLVSLCLWVMYRLRLPEATMDRKVSQAERMSYYVISRNVGPKFFLSGRERVIKIISHAILEDTKEYTPQRVVSYGLRVRISNGSRTLWQHDTLIDSRQSKAGEVEGVWLYENAFTSQLDTEMTDDRVLIVHLPEDTRRGNLLEITLLGDPKEALILVYEQLERSASERERVATIMGEAAVEAMVQRASYAPWALMSAEERDQRLTYKYLRMAAIGEPGVDFQTRSVFYTGFRLPMEELEVDEGYWIDHYQALALNVVGPTRLRLALTRQPSQEQLDRYPGLPPGMSPEEDPAASESGVVRIRAIAEAEEAPTWELPLPEAGASSNHDLEIPAGLHSLQIRTDSVEPVRIDMTGPPDSEFGAVPYLDAEDGNRQLIPDERRFVIFETGPDRLPVLAGLFRAEDARASILRLDVRIAVASPPEDESKPLTASIQLAFLDSQGRVLGTQSHEVTAPYSPFERLERTRGRTSGISEPVGIRMVAPAETDRIRITAAQNVALRLYRFLPGPEAYQAPYRDVELGRSIWRYAPRDRRQWFHATPANANELLDGDQRATLVAQVRLQPTQQRHSSGAHADAVAVVPRGRPERQQILEPVPPELVGETLRTWPAGSLSRVAVGKPVRFRFTATSRPRLDYVVPVDQLGKTLTVRVDGKQAASFRLTSARGYWNLPRVASGEHDVEVATDATGVDLLLDRPPVVPASTRLVRRRTVYALADKPLEIAVRKPAGQHVTVTAVIYAPWTGASNMTEVRAVIGGGVPGRVTGQAFSQITVAERTLKLPAPRYPQVAGFVGVADQIAGYPRFITIPIGNDLVPGTHLVSFSLAGAPRLWARFFVTHQSLASQDRALQWRFEADQSQLAPDDAP